MVEKISFKEILLTTGLMAKLTKIQFVGYLISVLRDSGLDEVGIGFLLDITGLLPMTGKYGDSLVTEDDNDFFKKCDNAMNLFNISMEKKRRGEIGF